MMLKLQKRLAGKVAGCSPKRIVLDPARLEDIKEAITKTDIRMLIGEGVIKVLPKEGVSRARANKIKSQKSKGLRKGQGSRKGKATTRIGNKDTWMAGIRVQRRFIQNLTEKNLISREVYKDIYRKSKGGYFRGVNHIKIYLNEHKLIAPMKEHAQAPQASQKSIRADKKKAAAAAHKEHQHHETKEHEHKGHEHKESQE